jgi:hypothetical protein
MILILGFLGIVSATVHAEECFCLTHAGTGAILRGCEAFNASDKGAVPTALCTDPETLKKSVQKISPDWKRIEAGADRCVVCRPATARGSVQVPRGGDDAKKQ